MTVSQQIIEVLNDLCTKFGIVIDWSEANVLPQLQDFCGRFIQYNIAESIIWCVFPIPFIVMSAIWFAYSKKQFQQSHRGFYEEMMVFSLIVLIVVIMFSIGIWMTQALHIAECCTIPERVIVDYIQGLIG